MGGIVNWVVLRKEIQTYLSTNRTAYVTTLIDYYGISEVHDFPVKFAYLHHSKILVFDDFNFCRLL